MISIYNLTNISDRICCQTAQNETALLPMSTEQEIAILPVQDLITPMTEPFSAAFSQDNWDDNLYAFLVDEQLRVHRKKDKFSEQEDEIDDWMAEFEKLALMELRK